MRKSHESQSMLSALFDYSYSHDSNRWIAGKHEIGRLSDLLFSIVPVDGSSLFMHAYVLKCELNCENASIFICEESCGNVLPPKCVGLMNVKWA